MSRYCGWVGVHDDGRPFCVHGDAIANGTNPRGVRRWRCRHINNERVRRYRATDKGRASRQRENASAAAQSRKQLYQLTYVPPT